MVAGAVSSPYQGLAEAEAEQRRARGEGNVAPPPTGRSYVQIIRENVFSFINNVLFILGLGLVLVGRPTDALISVGIISINILVSVVQEVRAKRTLDRIALLTRPKARIVRDGAEREADPEEVVLGDLLRVDPGDQILVDGCLVDGPLQVDESLLTGESDLIAKVAGDPVFSGTFCVAGAGAYVAERVGAASTANQLAAGARAYRRILSPLQQEISRTIRAILLVVIYLELLVFVNNLVRATPLAEGVTQATVVAGLVPNGLFVAIALAYAMAAVRIIRYGALVQQANAVESLSSVNVLCLDKTGTLTTNCLRFSALHPLAYDELALGHSLGAVVASAGSRNKTAGALAEAFPATPYPVTGEIPFSSDRKWSAVAFDRQPGLHGVYALGAPEMLRPYCGTAVAWDPIQAQIDAWAASGLRVLLLVTCDDPTALNGDPSVPALSAEMTPAGLVSISDELRGDAQSTLEAFSRYGVNPKIISGDNPETVAALARQAGLPGGPRPVSGLELDGLNDAALGEVADSATIFGRITPHQKERLVEALRRRGNYVAMIGDGVNDVLSLKKANLGIAMQSGAQATRSVADIVLMNDSFAALAPAVEEGQRIVNGMQDILKLFMARIFTVMLLIVSGLVVGVFPINIRHSSLLTLLIVGIPAILLALWARPGPRPRQSLGRQLAHFVIPAGLLANMLGLGLFFAVLAFRSPEAGLVAQGSAVAGGDALLVAQTALTAFLILVGLALVIFAEPPSPWWTGGDVLSGDKRPFVLAIVSVVALAVVFALPFTRTFFSLEQLTLLDWALVILGAILWLFSVRAVWRANLLERFFSVE